MIQKRLYRNLAKRENAVLTELSKRAVSFATKADKGEAAVIMDVDESETALQRALFSVVLRKRETDKLMMSLSKGDYNANTFRNVLNLNLLILYLLDYSNLLSAFP